MTFVDRLIHPQSYGLIHNPPEVFIDLELVIWVRSSLFTCLLSGLVGVIGALLTAELGDKYARCW